MSYLDTSSNCGTLRGRCPRLAQLLGPQEQWLWNSGWPGNRLHIIFQLGCLCWEGRTGRWMDPRPGELLGLLQQLAFVMDSGWVGDAGTKSTEHSF